MIRCSTETPGRTGARQRRGTWRRATVRMCLAALRIAVRTEPDTWAAASRISSCVISIGPSSESNRRAYLRRALSPSRRTAPTIAATRRSVVESVERAGVSSARTAGWSVASTIVNTDGHSPQNTQSTILFSGYSTMPSPPAALICGIRSRTARSSRIVLTATQPSSLNEEMVGRCNAGSSDRI